jgi:cell division protein FtsB
VFEQLACKEAELELLKQREMQLESEIHSLKRNCQRDLKAG